jgi:predicted RecA/RadA family phage recombinase
LTLTTTGGTLTITLPSSVKVTKTTAGALKDLANGLPVAVSTTQDSSGNRTATSIFVLPKSSSTSNG